MGNNIGGPRFWLGYACALGTGMCSVSFVNWCRSRLGLPSLGEAEGEPLVLAGLASLLFMAAWLLGTWYAVRRRFEGHPDLAECKRLMALVFAASLCWAVWLAAIETFESPLRHPGLNVLMRVSIFCVPAVVAAPFAIRDPRHGFFCAGLSVLNGLGLGFAFSEEPSNFDLYLTGIRMAVVFLYVTAGMRVQRIMAAILAPLSCSTGLLGAVIGTSVWAIRRRRAAKRRLERELLADIERLRATNITQPDANDGSSSGTSS